MLQMLETIVLVALLGGVSFLVIELLRQGFSETYRKED